MMTKYKLTVIVPAYNEQKNFESGVLDGLRDFLRKQTYVYEVIVVDDGSTDKTYKLVSNYAAKNKNWKAISIVHAGKAAAVIAGIMQAKGEFVLFTDFDQSTPATFIAPMLIQLTQNKCDVAIGVRTDRAEGFVSRLRSYVFLKLVQTIALPGILDSQCGFKMFKTTLAQKIFSSLIVSKPKSEIVGGYMGAFDVEVLYLVKKAGAKISQVPVKWTRVESQRLNIWTEPFKMLQDTIKVRLYDILGKYE